MENKINDGGKRINYGENTANREPSDGKGRPDLISPWALTRLSKWYELGANKYTIELKYTKKELISAVEKSLEAIIGANSAVQINYMPKKCAENVMTKISGKQTQSSMKDKKKIGENGQNDSQRKWKKLEKKIENDIKIQNERNNIERAVDDQFLKKEDLPKTHINYFSNGKIIYVQSVEEILMKLEQFNLIMTIKLGTQEEYYAVDAITESECLKNLLTLCRKLYPTFQILPQINSYPENNTYGIIKKGDYNWQNGMPFSRYTASMFRHLIAWMKKDDSEDHLSAIAWNAFAIMHHQELGEDKKWDDIPKRQIGSE